MNIKEAARKRHAVKKYTGKAIPADIVSLLNDKIMKINQSADLDLLLVTGKSDGLSNIAKFILSKGVKNYFILTGKESPELDEKLGYHGAELMLYSQMLGLNTWWIGGTYNSKNISKYLKSDEIIAKGIIVVGYGETQGVVHKCKKAEEIATYDGIAPQWFQEGIEFLLCAPTAYNKQDFVVKGNDNKVRLYSESGSFGEIETGIGKYHFEVGAGKENFEWIE